MIKFEDIKKANDTLITLDVKGKDYVQVNERIKAFRMVYPEGTIQTEMLSNEGGVCIFKATAFNGELLLATGHAYEKEGSTFINKTSYIENCETSAIGRCLGMCGFGIDTSVASAEEVQNAIEQQKEEEDEFKNHMKLEVELSKLIDSKGIDYDKLVELYKTDDIHKMGVKQLRNAIDNIDKFEKVQDVD